MLLHVLNLEVQSRSLRVRPWIDRLYAFNDLRAALPHRASKLTLEIERVDSRHAIPISVPETAVFAETNLCTGRCYYDRGRFFSTSESQYAHAMEYDIDAHLIRANLGGIYLENPQAIVSNLIRPILQSFILPFYGLKTLHGAVLSKGSYTTLLLGAGGAGKSTTATQMAHDGYDLIADDGPFFTLDGSRAYAMSSLDYLHVTDNTLSMFPELVPHVVGGRDHREKYAVARAGLRHSDAWRRPLHVDTIVKIRRGSVAQPRVTAYDKHALMQELLTESMTVFRPAAFRDRRAYFTAYSDFIFDIVTAVVKEAQAFELEFANHDLPEVPELIERLATHGG
jgi:hypothetical protein